MKTKLLVLASPFAASATAFAQTADPTSAGAGLAAISGVTVAYGPPLFGLAVVATGIMIGIAWIKKARGAAR